MAIKNKYNLMDSSVVTDKDGNNYPDLATFPINQIRMTEKPVEYTLNQANLYRFFDLCYEYYGNYELYDFLTLWLNDINDISNEENFGRTIKFYGKNDIDNWYVEHMKS